ncbi:hypothetical protein SELMODRAFT_451352 [Selaginella moellendorffii]|uniref:Uncharacterized protein WOX2-1 n=1 Tax=Selaginella moellendorffii TaxID=88036 RepID=D8QUE1_SELML|nr:hypothetical protein SELMODRAFT_451352 [Selaginella moellendorffii]
MGTFEDGGPCDYNVKRIVNFTGLDRLVHLCVFTGASQTPLSFLSFFAVDRSPYLQIECRGAQAAGIAGIVRQRWEPNSDQLQILEEFYANSTPPSPEITDLVGRYGAVDHSNVYYWFTNKNSREKRKRRRLEEAPASPAIAPTRFITYIASHAASDEEWITTSLSLSLSFDQSHRSFTFLSLRDREVSERALLSSFFSSNKNGAIFSVQARSISRTLPRS